MDELGRSGEGATGDQTGLERMVFFSDAVFAVAITLLALDIRLPSSAVNLSEPDLRRALIEIAPKYLAYALSFITVGLIWLGHHRKFRRIIAYDAVLMRINLLLMMVVAVVPFVTSILSEYRYLTSVVLYAATMMVLSLLSAATWAWAARGERLIHPETTDPEARLNQNEPLKVAAVFALSILVAFASVNAAMLVWLLIIPATMTFRRDAAAD